MIELRWKIEPPPNYGEKASINAVRIDESDSIYTDRPVWAVLQYRSITARIDATGALNVLPAPVEWTDWEDVEISDEVD